MSEEIMFSDMLNHYSLKLSEIQDMFKCMTDYLGKSVLIVNESWSSQSADAFKEKIEYMQQYINRVDLSLDELLSLLYAVKNNSMDDTDINIPNNGGILI